MQYISGEPGQRTAFTRTFARVTLPSLSKIFGKAIARIIKSLKSRMFDGLVTEPRKTNITNTILKASDDMAIISDAFIGSIIGVKVGSAKSRYPKKTAIGRRALISFTFIINHSFKTGPTHPITVPKGQVDYQEACRWNR